MGAVTGARSTSANFDFGQFLDVEFWDNKVWGPRRVEPRRVEPRRVGVILKMSSFTPYAFLAIFGPPS